LTVYGDNPYTPEDEGAEEGDAVHFTMNGICTKAGGLYAPVWTQAETRREVDLHTAPCLHLEGLVQIDDADAPLGTVITAHAPDGHEIGRTVVRKVGHYGVWHIPDDGTLKGGDDIHIRVQGQRAATLAWQSPSQPLDKPLYLHRTSRSRR
jgi:hypothetical protein